MDVGFFVLYVELVNVEFVFVCLSIFFFGYIGYGNMGIVECEYFCDFVIYFSGFIGY